MNKSFEYKSSWFQKKILNWYFRQGRDFPWRNNSASNYQVIITEVLLQRTRAETVAIFFPSFIKAFPSWKRLSKATEAKLRTYLKPIGLWKQRASVLYRLSREMAKRNGRFPRTRQEIDQLPGVGQYIANAIELFCHGTPKPLLDVNMARLLERFFGPRTLADIRHDPYLQKLAQEVLQKDKTKERKAICITWS